MKIPITVKIDHAKKALFESTKQIHGKTFTDALDESITRYLSDIVPADLLELKIQQTEDELKAMRDNLIKVRIIQQNTQTNENTTDDIGLQQFREQKFIDQKKSIVTMIRKNTISWKTIMNVFMFDSQKETQTWILNKIEESNNTTE